MFSPWRQLPQEYTSNNQLVSSPLWISKEVAFWCQQSMATVVVMAGIATWCMVWRSEYNCIKSIYSFHIYLPCGHQIQIIKLKHLVGLSDKLFRDLRCHFQIKSLEFTMDLLVYLTIHSVLFSAFVVVYWFSRMYLCVALWSWMMRPQTNNAWLFTGVSFRTVIFVSKGFCYKFQRRGI